MATSRLENSAQVLSYLPMHLPKRPLVEPYCHISVLPGNSSWTGRLSTVDLLVEISCFVEKETNRFILTWSILVQWSNAIFIYQEARYSIGENLKVVWPEFSTLSWTVLLKSSIRASHTDVHFWTIKIVPGFVLLTKVFPCIHLRGPW